MGSAVAAAALGQSLDPTAIAAAAPTTPTIVTAAGADPAVAVPGVSEPLSPALPDLEAKSTLSSLSTMQRRTPYPRDGSLGLGSGGLGTTAIMALSTGTFSYFLEVPDCMYHGGSTEADPIENRRAAAWQESQRSDTGSEDQNFD